MQVAVTGGSGELGTLVLRRLLADRAVKRVVSIDLRPPSAAGTKLEAVQADVRDPEIGRHFEGLDAVVHLAFVVTQLLRREEFDAINVGGSRNVFEAAVRAGVRRLVYSSSIAAYGVMPGQPVPLLETTPRRRSTQLAYSAAKYDVEAFLDGFEAAHPEVAIARLRPAVLVGARMEHVLGDMFRRRVLITGARGTLPIVWDEDVADAVGLALKSAARGAFNLGTDEPLDMEGLAQAAGFRTRRVPRAVVRGAGIVGPWLAKAGFGRNADPAWLQTTGNELVPSSEKARTELGWRPRCRTAAEVMRRYAEVVPHRLDRRLATFFRVLNAATRLGPPIDELRTVAVRIHLELTGPAGGDAAISVEQGRVAVSPGVPRRPDAIATMTERTMLALLAGKQDFAAAQLTGKVRIEGVPVAAMVVQGIVATFRARVASGGLAGAGARRLSGWFEGGAS